MQRLPVPVRLLALVLAVAGLTACGSASTPTGPARTPTPTLAGSFSGIVAASEFVVGTNRFPFGLIDLNGRQLEGAAVSVRFSKVDGEQATLKAEANAEWRAIESNTLHVHPGGEQHIHIDFQGVYVVDAVELDEPGIWIAEFSALHNGSQSPTVEEAAFQVMAEAEAVAVGEPAPATDNPTLADAPFAELSSRQVETDDLHNLSVADAIEANEPFVVVFASPQFCVSAMCGPVVDTMDGAREELGGEVAFIHIEPWDLTVARNEGRLQPSTYLLEWRLPTEPWVFVVGADGRVAARFEGLVTGEEVVSAVRSLP